MTAHSPFAANGFCVQGVGLFQVKCGAKAGIFRLEWITFVTGALLNADMTANSSK
jgi:hypothetical protein